VRYFVLDEADRMLDMGFIHAIRRVLQLLPPRRQNLMFSATYSEEIRELAKRFLRDPATVEVAPRNATADRVEQTVYRVSKDHKRHLLAHLIDNGNWHQVLVFTRTKHGANRLAQQLEDSGIRSAAIHGNKSQSARVRALADFKDNKITALVATEVAARGLDIKELPHVVNYELPNVPEDYVHRIGRTARAGGTGSAVSLVAPDEAPLLRDIERLLRRSLSVSPLPEFQVTAPARQSSREDGGGGDSRSQDPGARRQEPRNERGGAGRHTHSREQRHGHGNTSHGHAPHGHGQARRHGSRHGNPGNGNTANGRPGSSTGNNSQSRNAGDNTSRHARQGRPSRQRRTGSY
jgi:ATP-dependent RNA helicase RhlE